MRRSSRPPTANLSDVARENLGKVWKFLITTGKYDPWIEFYDGPMPARPEERTTNANKLLCRLQIDKSSLRAAQGTAIASGDASWARIIGADGSAVMDCKMTLTGGGGVIEWNTLELRKGGPVFMPGSSLNFYRSREEAAEAIREEDERLERRAELERMEREDAVNRAAELARLRRHGEAG
jgi:hypothetical protein